MWTYQLQCKGRVVVALTVFVGDNLPELGSDLVAALAALDVYDLTPFVASLSNFSELSF